jgi:RNA polymerase sigma factor (TIGR02999 family)
MPDISQLLNSLERGDPHATNQLLPLLYDELRRLAAQQMANEKPGHTLQPTALVHEAYLRLLGGSEPAGYRTRSQFFAAAALAMRHILIDNARRKARDKRGGAWARVPLLDHAAPPQHEAEHLLALDEALLRLAATDPQAAELVQLHTFGGLSVEEAGQQLGLSRAAAYRQWAWARAWLRCEVGENSEKS